MGCPDDNQLAELAARMLPAAERALVEEHLDGCERCRKLVAVMAQQGPFDGLSTAPGGPDLDATVLAGQARLAPGALLAPGDRVSRYTVLELLGQGGMGVVVAAYDPELDRRVALKLLRGEHDRDRSERLRAEARALARLSHPNVVAVHEIVRWGERDVVAMEFVEGDTVAGWLARAPRTTSEVLAVFRAAGAGLAAAHRAGLVHRDIKPSNILVGEDGRVRVGDFGLAREVDGSPAGHTARDGLPPQAPSSSRTETGAVVGTPAYMSPEQCRGEVLDARSDQFSLCVSLYEALHGVRPFDGEGLTGLIAAIERGAPARGPSPREVPASIERALLRGLSADPAARFPSVDELVAALETPRPRGRARVVVAVVAALAFATAVAITWIRGDRERAPTCASAPARLAGVWDADVRAAAERAFASVPDGGDAFGRAASALDAYATDWVAVARDACEATHVRREQSATRLELRTACLDGRRSSLAALARAMTGTLEADLASRLVEAAHRLPPVRECSAEQLDSMAPDADDPRARAALERIAAAEVLLLAGEARVALAEASAAVAAAPPRSAALARALLAVGQATAENGQRHLAAIELHAAMQIATLSGDRTTRASAAVALLQVIGVVGVDLAAAAAMEPLTALVVASDGSPALARRYAHIRADLTWHRGDYRGALVALQRLLAETELALGPDHVEVMYLLFDLGSTHESLLEHEPAAAAFRRALAIAERTLGPDHPRTALIWSGLGDVSQYSGEIANAAEHYRRALAIVEARLGPHHADTATQLHNLGDAMFALGDLREARARYERALAIREVALGRSHPRVATTLTNLALLLMQAGEPDAAVVHASRALAIYEQRNGPEHPSVAPALMLRAQLADGRGDHAAARADLERALAINETHFGPDNELVDGARLLLCENAVAREDVKGALAECQRAVDGAEQRAADVIGLVRARWSLAEAVWAEGVRRPHALALARAALALLDTAEGDHSAMRAELAAWIARPGR